MNSWKLHEYIFVLLLFLIGIRVFIPQYLSEKYYKQINIIFFTLFLINLVIQISLINRGHKNQVRIANLEEKTDNIEDMPFGMIKIGDMVIEGANIFFKKQWKRIQREYNNENYDKTLIIIEETEKAYPNKIFEAGIIIKAMCLYEKKDYSKALNELKRLEDSIHQENRQIYYYGLGSCYERLNNLNNAGKFLKLAIDINTNSNTTENAKRDLLIVEKRIQEQQVQLSTSEKE